MFHPNRGASAREPFVGRRREIAELEAGLQSARAGRGRVCLVFGEAGIGKTRLGDEMASRADALGMTVVWGRCWEAGGAPAYWPWTQALRALVATVAPERIPETVGVGAHQLAEIVPELRANLSGLETDPLAFDSVNARFYFFDAVTRFFGHVAAKRPLLIVIDDLHRADRPSLLLLAFLARQLPKLSIQVVATARDLESRSDPEVARLFDDIARDGSTISLAGLSLDDSAALIEISIGTPPPRTMIRSLHETTDGNPYCLGEFARLIRAETGSARTTGWQTFRLPADTRAAIGRRLDKLGAECRRVLSVASVFGREFAIAQLREVSGLDEASLLDALAEAEREGLVRPSPRDGRLRGFSHVLIRQALYEEVSPYRRASLHREIGESLERLYDRDPDAHVAEVAHHFCEAARGGLINDKAIVHERRAAERAVALLAYEEGQAHYQRALELCDLVPGDEHLRCDLLAGLGEAANKAGDGSAGDRALTRAIAVARAIRSPEHLARAVVGLGLTRLELTTVDPERVALLEETLSALAETDSPNRARLLGRLALALYWDPASARRRDSLTREAVEIAQRLGDPATLAYTLENRHYALWDPDHVEERLAAATEMLRLADRLAHPEVALQAHSWRLSDLLEIGDIAAVDVEVARRTRLAEELRQPLQRSHAIVSRAMRAILDGRFAAAERLAEDARVLGSSVDADRAEIRFLAQLVTIRREQGRAEELELAVRRMIERYPFMVAWRATLAAVYADLGRPAEARAEFEIVAHKSFVDLARDMTWFSNLASLTDACVFLADAPRAELLYDRARPHAARNLVVGSGECALGSASRLLGRLAFVLSRIENAARHFEAAIEMNERMGARPWLAHVQHEYAEVLLARGKPGDRERAEDLLRRALATGRELGMKGLIESISDRTSRRRAARALEVWQDGDSWIVGYQGSVSRLRDSKGIRVLAHLVKHPGADFRPGELAAAADGCDVASGSATDQIRVNLTKTIKAAIDKIAASNPLLGTHLRGAVRTGRLFRYGAEAPSA